MKLIKTSPFHGSQVAKRALFLAYNAGRAAGMGLLHERAGATEDRVWSACMGAEDYQGSPYMRGDYRRMRADYVLGRMLKMSFEFDEQSISFPDHITPRSDYQSWAGTFPTYEELIAAAMNSLLEDQKKNSEVLA